MEKRHDIKGILFNFSGTIDTEGSDWFDLIWKEYREIGIPITKSDYLAAHEFAEKEISYFKRIIIRQSMYSKVCPTTSHDLL